jgi:hypothetical protein
MLRVSPDVVNIHEQSIRGQVCSVLRHDFPVQRDFTKSLKHLPCPGTHLVCPGGRLPCAGGGEVEHLIFKGDVNPI